MPDEIGRLIRLDHEELTAAIDALNIAADGYENDATFSSEGDEGPHGRKAVTARALAAKLELEIG